MANTLLCNYYMPDTVPNFFFFFWQLGLEDLSSPTRDGTPNPLQWKQSPDLWTARKVPKDFIYTLLFTL